MFSKDLEQTIGQCYKRAREARHEFMTVEHLLLALLENPSAQAVLKATGADANRLRADLEQAIEASVSRLAEDDGRDTQPTLGFQRVLQRAVYHVQSSGKKEVTGANVLVAIFGEKDSHAVSPASTSSTTCPTASPNRVKRTRPADSRRARARPTARTARARATP
jgi:ATP-dependent Clp protease ATP-binding subunit ClpA